MAYEFRACSAVPALGIRRGDLIVFDPDDGSHPLTLHRSLPSTAGILLAAFVEGMIESIGTSPPSWMSAQASLASSDARVLPFPSAG